MYLLAEIVKIPPLSCYSRALIDARRNLGRSRDEEKILRISRNALKK
jgi:hypothetical protein